MKEKKIRNCANPFKFQRVSPKEKDHTATTTKKNKSIMMKTTGKKLYILNTPRFVIIFLSLTVAWVLVQTATMVQGLPTTNTEIEVNTMKVNRYFQKSSLIKLNKRASPDNRSRKSSRLSTDRDNVDISSEKSQIMTQVRKEQQQIEAHFVGLEDLPDETFSELTKHLNYKQINAFTCSSKHLKNVADRIEFGRQNQLGSINGYLSNAEECRNMPADVKKKLKAIFITWDAFIECEITPQVVPELRLLYFRIPDTSFRQRFEDLLVFDEDVGLQLNEDAADGNEPVIVDQEQEDAEDDQNNQQVPVTMDRMDKFHPLIIEKILPFTSLDHFSFLDATGQSLLMIAIMKEYGDIIDFLLEKNADVEAVNEAGENTLMIACQYAEIYAAESLIEKKVLDINAQDLMGNSALHFAARAARIHILEAILSEGGVQIDIRNNEGSTPLMLAAAQGHDFIMSDLLLRKADINAQDNDGHTPLMLAVKKNKYNAANVLLYAENPQADLELKNKDGKTALMITSELGKNLILPKLLNKQANIEAVDKQQNTALSLAAASGKFICMELLISNGAKIEHENQDGWTPLMLAAFNDRLKPIQLLLHSKANIDHQGGKDQLSALMIAVQAGHTDIAEYLLTKQADRSLTNVPQGFTAEKMAEFSRNQDMIEVFYHHDRVVRTLIF